MMNDLHNIIENKCNKAFKAVKARLIYEYDAVAYNPVEADCDFLKNADNCRGLFLINRTVLNVDFELIIAIPSAFPYKFPKIFLSTNYEDYKYLPHIDNNLFICTFDPYEAMPNPDKPVEVCIKVINKALEVLKRGLLKENISEYFDEFLAYWDLDTKNDVISIIRPGNKSKEICVIPLNPKYGTYSYLISDSIMEGINWANNLSIKINRESIMRGLYLPIKNIGIPPYPSNNKELVKCLKETCPDSLKSLYNFLDNNKRPTLIIFGIEDKNNWILGGWEHKVYKQQMYNGKNKTLYHQKGFRKGRQHSFMELTGFAKDLNIDKYQVDRFDKQRLYTRGGEGLSVSQDYRINLIGCGSIGSFLIGEIVKIGFNDFNLIDNQLLSVENIARHYCGVQYINFNKAEALKNVLGRNYPHLNISIDKKDARNIILEDQDYLNNFNLNIICVADYSLETMINQLYKNKIVKKNLLVVWVEPFLKTGQAVLLIPNKEGCLDCLFDFNSKLRFKYSISEITQDFRKRESGCQSSYIPYGAIDISSFVNFLTRIVDKIHKQEFKDNTLFQWIKTDQGLENTFKIRYFNELENFELCKLCKGH